MTAVNSYRIEQENRDVAGELERLRRQATLSWQQEARLLRWIGLADGMCLLELGCGPGYVTEQLAADWPGLSITALDHAADLLAQAVERLGSSRVTWVQDSAESTSLAPAQFDFVLARYLFQHLPDPAAVAREAYRLLRPGGCLAVIDIDDGFWGAAQPSYPQLPAIYAKAGVAQAERGGDRFIGRKLYRLLQSAGFQAVELEAFVYHSDALGMEPFLPQLSPDRLLVAVRSGAISPREFALAQALFHHFLAAPDAFVLMAGLLAHGHKPHDAA